MFGVLKPLLAKSLHEKPVERQEEKESWSYKPNIHYNKRLSGPF